MKRHSGVGLAMLLYVSILWVTGCDDEHRSAGVMEGSWRAVELIVTGTDGVESRIELGGSWVEELRLVGDGTYDARFVRGGVARTSRGRWTDEGKFLRFSGRDGRIDCELDGDTLWLRGSVPEGYFALRFKRDE